MSLVLATITEALEKLLLASASADDDFDADAVEERSELADQPEMPRPPGVEVRSLSAWRLS